MVTVSFTARLPAGRRRCASRGEPRLVINRTGLTRAGTLARSHESQREMKRKTTAKQSKPLYRQKLRERNTPLVEARSANDLLVVREEPATQAKPRALRCIELFSGAGGLALAASNAGFQHDAVLEYDHDACETIRSNQRRGYELVRHWPLLEGDVHHQDFRTWHGRADLVSGGPPCQPFSIGGKHRAMGDHRNLSPKPPVLCARFNPGSSCLRT